LCPPCYFPVKTVTDLSEVCVLVQKYIISVAAMLAKEKV
jgi:hypothetical protein